MGNSDWDAFMENSNSQTFMGSAVTRKHSRTTHLLGNIHKQQWLGNIYEQQ